MLLLLTFQQTDNQQNEYIKPIDVTTAVDVIPGRYYQTNGQYHLDLSGIPHMIVPIKNLPDNINDYNMLVINNPTGFQSTNLFLTAQLTKSQSQSPITFKQKLISSRQSINQLSSEWQQAETISKVALVVDSNLSLGFSKPSDYQVSWQSIQFTNNKHIKPTHQLISVLTAFVPLDFSSINLNNGEIMTLYKSMLVWLCIWILISSILFFMIKPAAIHLFVSLAIAWLLTTVVYGYNFTQQTQFNQQFFAEHNAYLNQTDRQLSLMANKISDILSKEGKNKLVKIMIIGSHNFDNKRLNYHLLQYNVGIISDYEMLMANLEEGNNYAVLLPPFNKECEIDPNQENLTRPDILLKTNQFCLIQ